MMLKLKAFIYRFSDIFGLHIYLANKEEQEYIRSLETDDEFVISIQTGLWQAHNGFTTVFIGRKPFHKALIAKIKHAFKI